MLKIGTHDSGTGERPANFLSWLLIPFARTQSKTIKEQYDAGCRMFDIRVRKYKNNWYIVHGCYITKKLLIDAIEELNSYDDLSYILVTYEGKLNTREKISEFKNYILELQSKYTMNIGWGPTAVKYTNNDLIVDWVNLLPGIKCAKNKQGFLPLDGKHWQTYIPIPWLWKKIYFNKPKFNEDYFTLVDFL